MTASIIKTAEGKCRHKGDLVIEGDVKQGTYVLVTDGNLVVKGAVEDGAIIRCVSSMGGPDMKTSATICGAVGNGVVIQAAGDVELHQDAGDTFTGAVKGKFTGQCFGARAEIVAETISIASVGEVSIINAQTKTIVLHAGEGTQIRSRGSFHGQTVANHCSVSAARAFIDHAHEGADIQATQEKRIYKKIAAVANLKA